MIDAKLYPKSKAKIKSLEELLGNAVGDAIVKSLAKAERANTQLTEVGII